MLKSVYRPNYKQGKTNKNLLSLLTSLIFYYYNFISSGSNNSFTT